MTTKTLQRQEKRSHTFPELRWNKHSRKQYAIETSDSELREEIRRAERLCKEEEDECSSAETLDDDSDYVNDDESSSESYESDFIDDTNANDDDAVRAIHFARHLRD